MRNKTAWFCLLATLEVAMVCSPPPCSAQPTNAWTSPASGHWEDPNWSLGTLPDSSQAIAITNAGFKAVQIGSSTAASFPNSLTIDSLNVSGPTNGFNTLLLNFAGTSVPLHVLDGAFVGSNGVLMNLSSAFQVDGASGGSFTVADGNVIDDSGAITIAPAVLTSLQGGTMELTNSLASFGVLNVQSDGGTNYGSITQSGGQVTADLSVEFGTYDLLSGNFFGTCSSVSGNAGGFVQDGGTNFANVFLGYSSNLNASRVGYYTLNNGAVVTPNMVLGHLPYGFGVFSQGGGTVSVATLSMGTGANLPGDNGAGEYDLTNGDLFTGKLNLINAGFQQMGGRHITTNELDMFGNPDRTDMTYSDYILSGGNLVSPAIGIAFSAFTQSGGTNSIANNLTFANASYTLSGGVLTDANTVINYGYYIDYGGERFVTVFAQSGGQHLVSGVVSNFDEYILSGGSLSANQIFQHGTLIVSNGAPITCPGGIDLGGSVRIYGNASEHLGPATLSAGSVIDLESGSHTLAFADSSSLAWNNASTLVITNWNGSTIGGGPDQVIFGGNAGGLTAAQLSRIQFANPAGFAPGRYGAQILDNGEVVPGAPPQLSSSHSSDSLILTWTAGYVLQSSTNIFGPYTDVTNATSPYTNFYSEFPSRFFRLRQ